MFDLKKHTALVTGAGQGVGVGIAKAPALQGAAVVYLASEEASWVTGQVIPVNGGSVTA